MKLALAALLLLAFGVVGSFDFADQLVIEAQEKEARPARVMHEYHRWLLCDCLKQHKGKNLRLQIAHQPDQELCYAACFYEGGAATKGTL